MSWSENYYILNKVQKKITWENAPDESDVRPDGSLPISSSSKRFMRHIIAKKKPDSQKIEPDTNGEDLVFEHQSIWFVLEEDE